MKQIYIILTSILALSLSFISSNIHANDDFNIYTQSSSSLTKQSQKTIEKLKKSIKQQHLSQESININAANRAYKEKVNKSSDIINQSEKNSKYNFNIVINNKTESEAITMKHSLHDAYMAFKLGQIEVATHLYEEILYKDPENLDALFALGTIYHMNYQFEDARDKYIEILSINPQHNKALNNFLALLSNEDPSLALAEMKKLEKVNNSISVIPAQIAMIYYKLNDLDNALEYLKKAIYIEPKNTNYRYNFAIMLDKSGYYQHAAMMYRELINISYHGYKIPIRVDQLTERILYLSSKM